MKGFLQGTLQEIMKKNNTWKIRRSVYDSFVPSSKQPSLLYCKLTDFIMAFFLTNTKDFSRIQIHIRLFEVMLLNFQLTLWIKCIVLLQLKLFMPAEIINGVKCRFLKCSRSSIHTLESWFAKLTNFFFARDKVIYHKYSKHWPYLLAATKDCT